VAGNLAAKQDACCLILEQLEIFKNGGPVIFFTIIYFFTIFNILFVLDFVERKEH
jgi:hypothetical protein